MGADTSAMYATLVAGQNQLDLDQSVTFSIYEKTLLPIDQYVFWSPVSRVTIKGALHIAQEIQQSDEDTYAAAHVTFTAQDKVAELEAAPTNRILVASTSQGTRYAFHAQNGFFTQANIWHYFGHSIPPAMLTQLLDRPGLIDLSRPVVSNSLAFWIQLGKFKTPFADWFSNSIPLYPAQIVPANLEAPYIAVNVYDTRALQAIPKVRRTRSSHQLMADKVRLVLYGLQSDEATDFQNCVNSYMAYTGNFGLMNVPALVDDRRSHSGIEAIAMRKVIDYEISYIHSRVDSVARTLIKKAYVEDFFIGELFAQTQNLGTQGGLTFTTQGGQVIEAQ